MSKMRRQPIPTLELRLYAQMPRMRNHLETTIMSEPWETTARYGRADLSFDATVRDAYKVACLIERCGASEQLTAASSAAFNLCIAIFDRLVRLNENAHWYDENESRLQ